MNEHISKIINHPKRNQVITGVVAFAGGGALGYFLGQRQKYEVYNVPTANIAIDMDDIERPELENGFRPEPLIIDEDVYIKKGTTFVSEHLTQVEEDAEEPEVVAHNVFAESDIDWNMEEEVARRELLDPRIPYILHKDEFYAEEKDYTQSSLTYYAGDNILVDEQETPIYNHEDIVGPLRFGHGSGDSTVVYVRNDKLMAEYEISMDPGLYSVEVLGHEIENNERAKDLKHSSLHKFRED